MGKKTKSKSLNASKATFTDLYEKNEMDLITTNIFTAKYLILYTYLLTIVNNINENNLIMME